ncbi:TIGR03936 family radical SAM-associated protein [Defluviitalea phaphyphila]|uniref:TIGR03936 family radical SAM-associated protein n=1 Tax=Defluviitalea phaphyphila TaxID=1473580 RepID=UPI000730EC46|nr:TIGR03936 family radical SAM-associated protein [Defluviitalea phaphyphila]
MRARIKFTKLGNLKFIGHLDLLRLFQRCIRRANIPIEYSKGFNPHQNISFALPLPLGATSEGEYLDIKLNKDSDINASQIKNNLNKFLPEGIEVKEVWLLDNSIPVGGSIVDACKYQIFINKKDILDDFKTIVNNFFNQEEIIVEKKSKKGIKEVNIKNMIYDYSIDEEKEKWVLNLFLAAGSKINLKPELVIKGLYENNNLDFKNYKIQIHRLDIFYKKDDKFFPLSYFIME